MTYEIHDNGTVSELKNADGETIAELKHPISVPDDIINAILEDMGVGNPQQKALKVLFTQDWEYVDDTT